MASDDCGDADEAVMLAPIRAADLTKPFVVAQLGQSLDGRIATMAGESRWISGPAALDHVHRLRANVDAVIVGVGTVIADDPALNVRRVAGRSPARVVIDPRGRAPASARCLAVSDGCRRLVVRARKTGSAGVPEGVETVGLDDDAEGRIDPTAVIAALYDLGLRTLLIEGGAWTVSAFINAGAVDRLHMLIAPVILGSGKMGLSLAPIERLSQCCRPEAKIFKLAGGDVLFDCDLRSQKSC